MKKIIKKIMGICLSITPSNTQVPKNVQTSINTKQIELLININSQLDGINSLPCITSTNNKGLQSARIDLNSLNKIPPETRTVIMSSNSSEHSLSNLNPIQQQTHIEEVCGPVHNIKPLKSGSLIITTSSIEQVHTLLNTKTLSPQGIPINCIISWNKQFTLRKLWAPHFAKTPLDKFLNYLRPVGAVSVRKLYSDPSKQDFPLFVVTFLGNAPAKVQKGIYIL